MRLDKFNNPIFNETEIFDALYTGRQTVLPDILTEDNFEINTFCEIAEFEFAKLNSEIYDLSVEDYDSALQTDWFMPDEYYNFDIWQYCISKCKSIEEQHRVEAELQAYTSRNLTKLLQWLKYFVDTCKQHNIVWGVGRGSSVSSFVLYLLEVHKIHSIKYDLDWQDFLR